MSMDSVLANGKQCRDSSKQSWSVTRDALDAAMEIQVPIILMLYSVNSDISHYHFPNLLNLAANHMEYNVVVVDLVGLDCRSSS